MTPTDEARFIQLWNQGLSQDDMAQHLGIPVGTVKSRAHTLARQGKIQARPKGGSYPRQQAQRRSGGERGPSTVHPEPSTVDRPPSTVTHLQADLTTALTAALQPVLARLEALETGLARQGSDDRPPSTLVPWTVHPRTVHRPPWTLTPGS